MDPRTNYDYIAEDGRPVPTRAQIFAARVVLKGSRRLGREVEPEIIRDANWPLEDAAPYPDREGGRKDPRTNYDCIAEDGRPIPTRTQIYAARVVLKGSRRLGREVEPEIIRDANWPIEEAAPYPEYSRPAS